MNERRDPDRMIRAFLTEGQTVLADQVYDAVRAETEQKRQRVVIGPWRTPIMNKFVPIGLGAAAVVMALVVGTQLLGPRDSGGVGTAPSAEPSATAAPSVAQPSSTPDGSLPEGSHLLLSGGTQITVTIPASGWFGEHGILVKNDSDPPNGAGMIVFAVGDGWYVPGDPCDWDATMPDTRSATVDELVAALAAQASRDASTPVDITVGGFAGKSVTLHVPDDAVFTSCDQGKFCTLADPVASPGDSCYRYHQGPGQIDNMWIVDVNGQLVIIDWGNYEATPPGDVAELEAIVESITFE